jgi:hypothetical protein
MFELVALPASSSAAANTEGAVSPPNKFRKIKKNEILGAQFMLG